MNGYAATEDLEAMAEALEDYEADEADIMERRRGARYRTPVRTAPGTGLFQMRPQAQYVTQTQLQAALARVGAQIKTNADAIKTLNARVATVSADVAAAATALKKEVADRKKETDTLKRDLRQTREMAGIIPLLLQPHSVTTTSDVGGIQKGTRVMTDSGDSLSAVLPLLLLGGLGTGGGSGSGSGDGGSDSSMLLLALLLARR